MNTDLVRKHRLQSLGEERMGDQSLGLSSAMKKRSPVQDSEDPDRENQSRTTPTHGRERSPTGDSPFTHDPVLANLSIQPLIVGE